MDKKTVKEIALANGFKLKEQPDGSLELNPYVYVFADKLVDHQQAKVEELQNEFNDFKLRAHHISVQKLDADSFYDYEKKRADELQKRVDAAELTLNKLCEFVYGCGDLREYQDEELSETLRVLKAILAGEQALKGEG